VPVRRTRPIGPRRRRRRVLGGFTPAAKTIGSDGSVSDGGGSASGYSIVTADSLDEAVTKAKGCPVLQGGASITVYETFAVM
jgi:hypothetical protein